MIAEEFLELARELGQGASSASQRRAISTAYYAVFHKFAEVLTTGLLGFAQPNQGDPRLDEWVRVYRSYGHDSLEKATKQLAEEKKNAGSLGRILLDLSTSLTALKAERHLADYDPTYAVLALNITNSRIEDAFKAVLTLEIFFEQETVNVDLARKLALDVLGIRTRK
jgi:hypothetical protein